MFFLIAIVGFGILDRLNGIIASQAVAAAVIATKYDDDDKMAAVKNIVSQFDSSRTFGWLIFLGVLAAHYWLHWI